MAAIDIKLSTNIEEETVSVFGTCSDLLDPEQEMACEETITTNADITTLGSSVNHITTSTRQFDLYREQPPKNPTLN